MKKEITMSEIRKAITLITEDSPPDKTSSFWFGEITTNYLGTPTEIKFKREYIKEIKKIMKDNFRFGRQTKEEPIKKNTKLETIDGLKVLNQIRMDLL